MATGRGDPGSDMAYFPKTETNRVANPRHRIILAKFLKASPKPNQTRPSQTKKMALDFLGFLRPIRGFSMGYGQSKGIFFSFPRITGAGRANDCNCSDAMTCPSIAPAVIRPFRARAEKTLNIA